jgi:hypothetical protein
MSFREVPILLPGTFAISGDAFLLPRIAAPLHRGKSPQIIG